MGTTVLHRDYQLLTAAHFIKINLWEQPSLPYQRKKKGMTRSGLQVRKKQDKGKGDVLALRSALGLQALLTGPEKGAFSGQVSLLSQHRIKIGDPPQAENKKPKSGDQPSAKGATEQSGEKKGEEKRFLTHWIA